MLNKLKANFNKIVSVLGVTSAITSFLTISSMFHELTFDVVLLLIILLQLATSILFTITGFLKDDKKSILSYVAIILFFLANLIDGIYGAIKAIPISRWPSIFYLLIFVGLIVIYLVYKLCAKSIKFVLLGITMAVLFLQVLAIINEGSTYILSSLLLVVLFALTFITDENCLKHEQAENQIDNSTQDDSQIVETNEDINN